MSDINLDFAVNNNSIGFTVAPNDISFTPTDIQLTFGILPPPPAGGSNTQVQYNNNDVLSGSSQFTFDNTTNTVATYNLTTSNLANVATANIGNLIVTTDANLGDISNVTITGGSPNYVLLTDGSGNLTWGTTNASPGGSNTSIQFNSLGTFAGNSNFTFNNTTGNVNIPGSLNVTTNANILGNIIGNSNLSISNNTTTANLTISTLTKIKSSFETVTIDTTPATSTTNFDFLTQSVILNTGTANANVTLNVRGNSAISTNSILAIGQSVTVTYVMTTTSTPYGITALTIDGIAETIRWVNGIVPSQGANSTNSYTFTVIKTAATPTYRVLGSLTRYA